MKRQILEVIGERELNRASTIADALAANDRLKYYFSLLQMAIEHGDHPAGKAASLTRERLARGIDDASLDALVAGTRCAGDTYHVPGAERLMHLIADDTRTMAAPVIEAGIVGFAERLSTLLNALPACADDCLTADSVGAMTRADRRRDPRPSADSLHRLVMDLHKQLNKTQAELAEEVLDGASVSALADADRPRVRAFMAGLNRTAGLKFDHPGLATTATRAGDRLIIQNDIGTTDAHVIVIHVEALTVALTYSDVHPERVQFLRDMLAETNVTWSGGREAQMAELAAGMPFQLVTGTFRADDEAACLRYLEFLGSRLVFLIDWIRARKQLRGFLRGPDRLRVLLWAARNDVGHRGFLELGGARAINAAIEATPDSGMRFGDRLCDVLGSEPAVDFVQFALRAAARGLAEGQSHGLIHDRIRTELQRHVSNDARRVLEFVREHAGIIFEIASLARDGVLAIGTSDDNAGKRAKRARRFEHDADLLVATVREEAQRRPDRAIPLALLEIADDAADQLEDVAFLLDLLANREPARARLDAAVHHALRDLATLTVEAAREWIRALAHSVHVTNPGAREDTDDFLTAIDRIAVLEHDVDDAERLTTRAAIEHCEDFRQLHLCTTISDGLEESVDALKHASLMLRDHVLGERLDA
jgi:uncharacterized protein Yka (UPF0111/DUF47 family)